MVGTYNYYGLEATNVERPNGSGYDIVDAHTGVILGRSPETSSGKKTVEDYALENDAHYW